MWKYICLNWKYICLNWEGGRKWRQTSIVVSERSEGQVVVRPPLSWSHCCSTAPSPLFLKSFCFEIHLFDNCQTTTSNSGCLGTWVHSDMWHARSCVEFISPLNWKYICRNLQYICTKWAYICLNWQYICLNWHYICLNWQYICTNWKYMCTNWHVKVVACHHMSCVEFIRLLLPRVVLVFSYISDWLLSHCTLTLGRVKSTRWRILLLSQLAQREVSWWVSKEWKCKNWSPWEAVEAFKGNQGWAMVSGFKEGLNSRVEPTTSTKVGSTKGHKVAPANGSWGSPSSSLQDLIPALDQICQMDQMDQMDQMSQMDQMGVIDELDQMDHVDQNRTRLTSSQPNFEWVLRWIMSLQIGF